MAPTTETHEKVEQKNTTKLTPEEQTRADIEGGVVALENLRSMVKTYCPQLLNAGMLEIESFIRGQCKTLGIPPPQDKHK